MLINSKARECLLDIVKHYESLHDGDLSQIGLQPKMCPAGYWTEGYGQVVTDTKGKPIKGLGNKTLAYKCAKIKTVVQAEAALLKALEAREITINRYLDAAKIKLDDFQKAACISFAYNVGLGAFHESGLFQQLKKGFTTPQQRKSIDECFRVWNKGDGKVLPGLVKRRTCESYLFLLEELKLF